MTKVSVLGQEPEKQLKKIELVSLLSNDLDFISHCAEASDYDYVTLIVKNYKRCDAEKDFDLILVNTNDNEPILFIGHWNDGVV